MEVAAVAAAGAELLETTDGAPLEALDAGASVAHPAHRTALAIQSLARVKASMRSFLAWPNPTGNER